jgi:hypothetical protein
LVCVVSDDESHDNIRVNAEHRFAAIDSSLRLTRAWRPAA